MYWTDLRLLNSDVYKVIIILYTSNKLYQRTHNLHFKDSSLVGLFLNSSFGLEKK